jgi:hypothetical protein
MLRKLIIGTSSALVMLSEAAGQYVQPLTEGVRSVTGFYIKSGNPDAFLVPAQLHFPGDWGKVTLTSSNSLLDVENIMIQPVGDYFTFDYATNTTQATYIPQYIFHGPTFNLNYASYGWWTRQRPGAPFVYGTWAAGSDKNFSLPTTGRATFCGQYSAFNNLANTSYVNLQGSQMKLTTSWQHAPPVTEAQISTFIINGISSPNLSAGYAIHNDGTAEVHFRTLGKNGNPNGGLATALLKFYGPGAIFVSGTFYGPWEGQRIAGAFEAWLIPPPYQSC